MKRSAFCLSFLLCGFLILGDGQANAQAGSVQPYGDDPKLLGQADWTLVFSDEFDAPLLDQSKWATCYWWADESCTNSGNKELQLYHADGIGFQEGALRLRASHAALKGPKGRLYPYQSGIVTTARTYSESKDAFRFSFRYGYAEIRAKLPTGKGIWPAFWLLPEALKERPEIDVMEMLGDSSHVLRMHMHYVTKAGKKKSTGQTLDVGDMGSGWHRFAIMWDESKLVWLFDGKEQWRIDDPAIIPDVPMYLLLNLAVGGEWPGFPDEKTRFPADYLIDYVRVWQR